jgi:hypothetical protein
VLCVVVFHHGHSKVVSESLFVPQEPQRVNNAKPTSPARCSKNAAIDRCEFALF